MNVGSWVAVHIATQTAAREARVLSTLRNAGAVDAHSAIPLSLEARADEATFRRLLHRQRILESADGRYYLGAPPSSNSRTVAYVCIVLLVALGAVLIYVLASSSRGS